MNPYDIINIDPKRPTSCMNLLFNFIVCDKCTEKNRNAKGVKAPFIVLILGACTLNKQHNDPRHVLH